jgi:hypothetical protein
MLAVKDEAMSRNIVDLEELVLKCQSVQSSTCGIPSLQLGRTSLNCPHNPTVSSPSYF